MTIRKAYLESGYPMAAIARKLEIYYSTIQQLSRPDPLLHSFAAKADRLKPVV
jgi:hypothetical protein